MSNLRSVLNFSVMRALRSTLVVSISVFIVVSLRIVLRGIFAHHWSHDWRLAFGLALVFSGLWFLLSFAMSLWIAIRSAPVEEILEDEPAPTDLTETPARGFVAMEYFGLILNRTYVIFITPEGLYGWKASGPVSAAAPMYFEPFVEMLKDPELTRDKKAITRLSRLRGGFYISRSDIISIEASYKQKWGMGPVPHSGRIFVKLTSGRTREFILLGVADPEETKSIILQLGR